MKTIYPEGYLYNGFVTTYALGHTTYGYILLVPINLKLLKKQRHTERSNLKEK